MGAIVSLFAIVGAALVRRPADMMRGPDADRRALRDGGCWAARVGAAARQPQFGRQVRCDSASTSTVPRSSGLEAEYAPPLVASAIFCIAWRSVSGPKPIMMTATGLDGIVHLLQLREQLLERDAVLSSFLPSVMTSTELTLSGSYVSRTRLTASSVVS